MAGDFGYQVAIRRVSKEEDRLRSGLSIAIIFKP